MRPELDDTRVYFERELMVTASGITSAQLVALDRTTGKLLWNHAIISASTAAVAGDVVGAVWGGLEIVQRTTGAPRQRFTYSGTSLSGNVVSDGSRFYVVTHNGHALAVNPSSGAADWDTDLSAGSATTTGFGVTVASDLVVVTLKYFRVAPFNTSVDSGIVAAVDRATGALRWRVTLPSSEVNSGIVEPAVVTQGNAIAVTQGHHVVALDLQSGAQRWEFDASEGSSITASDGIAACDGMVIVPTGALGLVALDAATGSLRWKLGDIEQGSLFDLYCSYGTVMTIGGLRVFDAATGAALATYPLSFFLHDGSFWINSVVRDAEWLYVGTTRGYAKVKAP
jgi:outer membrane protein assembly factor BamB